MITSENLELEIESLVKNISHGYANVQIATITLKDVNITPFTKRIANGVLNYQLINLDIMKKRIRVLRTDLLLYNLFKDE